MADNGRQWQTMADNGRQWQTVADNGTVPLVTMADLADLIWADYCRDDSARFRSTFSVYCLTNF